MRWSVVDERVASLWYAGDLLRRNYRSLAYQTAVVMHGIAVTRRELARTYDSFADSATGEEATRLRARARRFDELAVRAKEFADKEREAANG